MAKLHTLRWKPIEDLLPDWPDKLRDTQTLTMVQAWQEQAQELRDKDLYKEFVARLQREWAIETGVIEDFYALDKGITETLIERGLDAVEISHEHTNEHPQDVLAKVKDQHHVILGLYQFVKGHRGLGTSYIKELHCALTAHQDTYDARDTLGNQVTRPLLKGAYKSLPNNVQHSDGGLFEFCPPEHVDAEMERLIEMHEQHESTGISPEVEAAWLHHRFTLIHPFIDGNGRVARCLATLVLLKAHWLPLVITRDDKPSYISALRSADLGDLKSLVDLIGALQRKAIREALSLTEDLGAIDSILAEVRAKLSTKRRADEAEQMHQAFQIADTLQSLTSNRLKQIAEDVNPAIREGDPRHKAYMYEGNRNSEKSKYHYSQIVQCATILNYFANLRFYQAWSALAIQQDQRAEILFSFHGIGHEASGVLGCSAVFYSKETTETGDHIVRRVTPLAASPFEFNYLDDKTDAVRRFQQWLEACIISGLNQWKNVV